MCRGAPPPRPVPRGLATARRCNVSWSPPHDLCLATFGRLAVYLAPTNVCERLTDGGQAPVRAQKCVGAAQDNGKARAVRHMRELSSKVLECVKVHRAEGFAAVTRRLDAEENDYAGCRYNVAIP